MPPVTRLKCNPCTARDFVSDYGMFALLHCEYTRSREGAVHASNVLLAAVHGPLVRFDEDIPHANPIEVAAMHKFLLHRSQRARNSLGWM